MTHIDQIRALANEHGLPQAKYKGDLEWDTLELAKHEGHPFLFALAPWGTQLYWFHIKPNPWGSLEGFLRSTHESMPGVLYWCVGLSAQPIELGPSPDAREILSMMGGV